MTPPRWTFPIAIALGLWGCAPAVAGGDGDAPPPPGAPGADAPVVTVPTGVEWNGDLAAAMVRAKRASRPLAIVFR